MEKFRATIVAMQSIARAIATFHAHCFGCLCHMESSFLILLSHLA